jgi:acyl-CoA thioesterase-2
MACGAGQRRRTALPHASCHRNIFSVRKVQRTVVGATHVRVGPDASNRTTPTNEWGGSLERAAQTALDGLLVALTLEPMGGDRFRAGGEADRFDRVFGGQVVAQALLAAGATVPLMEPDSLHAYFVEAGIPGHPVDVTVDRVRDGRSISTRRVTVMQGRRQLLTAIVSFHAGSRETGLADTGASDPGASDPAPGELPLLQEWVSDHSEEQRLYGLNWIEQPPPLEIRMDEAPNFMGGPTAQGPRTHWMRLPRDVGDDPQLHTALLAYASDYLLLDMVLRAHPDRAALGSFTSVSLDHSLWFHRPVRLERWHRYTQETQALSGHRGLVRGAIHDADGRLVASAMQEGLVRPAR